MIYCSCGLYAADDLEDYDSHLQDLTDNGEELDGHTPTVTNIYVPKNEISERFYPR